MKHIAPQYNVFKIITGIVLLTSIAATQKINILDVPQSHNPNQKYSEGNAPVIGTCTLFPNDNYWNTPIDNLPIHPLSQAWVNSIGANNNFHMDFGSGTWDGGAIGIPYNVVLGTTTTKHNVIFYYPTESDNGPYPIPLNPNIEHGSDHHILIVDSEDCTLYEIYDAEYISGQWYAGSGAIWNMNSNALRPEGWTSADAAGLPILPGLARYEEVQAGVINHALRFTTNCTANYYIWPARHVAQSGNCATPVPFGARFRLRSNYDISGFSYQAQVILQAMKTYGIVLADNGSPWYVSGAPNENWNNDVLHEMDVLSGNDFQAVDTAELAPWTFRDVPDSHWAWQYIESLYTAGITGGCSASPLNYCPNNSVTRAQMAVFLLRGIHGSAYSPPAATGTVFTDVPSNAFAAAWIEQLVAEGITSGCGNGNYCPDRTITRAQMAVFLLRAKYGSTHSPPIATGTLFADVPANAFAAAWIEQLVAEGITAGCGAGNYCPNNAVTRAQMAVFLQRVFNLPLP